MFSFLISRALSRSEKECLTFKNDSAKSWSVYQAEITENSINFKEDGTAEYNSQRYRKKWSLNLCGNITNSTFVFLYDEAKEYGEQNYINVEYMTRNSKARYSIYKNGKTVAQRQVTVYTKDQLCFSAIYGRGYIGIFAMPHLENKEPILLLPYTMPREHKLQYLSHEPSNITNICINDFFGDDRVDIDYDPNWKTNINNFL
ncbi:hypothetical protein TVAG_370010 [Trichomonas vaginalis G3]|uniref:Uncharacterized protein n=1 Tax=Trichomonas vaginalis (strain ATCC PRA-98 / G3) TaxID=412133 RepID=A2EX53_TRIV3|nr:hypothetical protein TVAGG3_0860090 [Trichomonas vaginalis G3]EAY02773.1 hypothetical protein TVAG_370010 [Trichomonas vaginalis G3]KAI5500607.1 hypothetical protein TVAGG3_0860090 [Trichomonas vaginalis G3]|eukprot:XP_001314996.1 hypothetical protein [Trichomonas vaginalis G3]